FVCIATNRKGCLLGQQERGCTLNLQAELKFFGVTFYVVNGDKQGGAAVVAGMLPLQTINSGFFLIAFEIDAIKELAILAQLWVECINSGLGNYNLIGARDLRHAGGIIDLIAKHIVRGNQYIAKGDTNTN